MAMVLEAFASYVDDLLELVATDEVGRLLRVTGDIHTMRTKLKVLKGILEAADWRNIIDENKSAQRWVSHLKRAMYEATDILDLCQLKALDLGASAVGTRIKKFYKRNPLHAYHIGTRIKEFNKRLEDIDLRFISHRSYEDHRSNMYTSRPGYLHCETSSELDLSDVVGEKIEEDTRALAELLCRNEVNNKNIMVVAIVGVGGIGKTTLAQMVFSNEDVRDKFNKKIWLSVSQNFDETELLRTAINLAGGDHHGAEALDVLKKILAGALTEKKVLLVMDDVWSDRAWKDVLKKTLVKSAASGSRVLITTRKESVAEEMSAALPYHHIATLSPEDAWSLLKKQVLSSDKDEGYIDVLKDIGLKFIQKCGGLPLAVKVMGGLLSRRGMTRHDWHRTLDDSKWSITEMPQEISHALYLSYEDMPPYLKQCFLHCCLLPRSNEFDVLHVVGMWISEGFVHGNSDDLEKLGREYFKDLISRNLVEQDESDFEHRYWSMHDVVRSFGQYMARDEALVAHNEETDILAKLSSNKFLRLSIETNHLQFGELEWNSLQEQKLMRTLISTLQIKMKPDDSLISFSSLRTLYINSADVALVESLHHLQHLRYLKLVNTAISALPRNIGKMKLLQYFDLEECGNLENLPDSIVKLGQLRYLNLPRDVSMIPRGFRELKNLRILGGFPALVDADGWCSLDELGALYQLRVLRLVQLQNAHTAASAKLDGKSHLRELLLSCTSRLGHDGLVKGKESVPEEEQGRIQEVFDELCPPPSVEYLYVEGYFAEKFPRWMTSKPTLCASLCNLKFLTMNDLACCTQLPDGLCELPSLQILQVDRAPCIVRTELQQGAAAAFPSLNKMILNGMVEWEEWEWEEQVQAMPRLEELRLQRCKLKLIPAGLTSHAKALRRLLITSVRNLSYLENFSSVVVLDLCFSPDMERVSGLPLLQKLTVILCPKLKVVKNVPALQKLVLEDYGMETLPEYMRDITPSYLEIECSTELLTSIAAGQSGHEWEKFSRVKHVKAYAHAGDNRRKWYVLYTENPFSIDTNVDISSMSGVSSTKDELKFVREDEYQLVGTHYSTFSSKYEHELVDEDEIVSPQYSMAPRKDEPEPIGKDEDDLVGVHNSSESAESYIKISSKHDLKFDGESEDELPGDHNSKATSEDERQLVGIDGPREHLIKMLDLNDHTQLKMVSICGTGGLGKTTIAYEVYRKIRNKFGCHAFVPVLREPDIEKIIRDLCEQVCLDKKESGILQPDNALIKFLEDKRYLIIFDGIWHKSVWDQILSKLGGGNNNYGSRIIITTRKVNVAEHVGCLYRLPLLSYEYSKTLFYRRTLFGSENYCPSEFRELCERMLSKCGLLPLAIIVMAKLLPEIAELEAWKNVCPTIEMSKGMEKIRKVLKLSYEDLGPEVRTCLLYLSIFPEGHEIRRDVLVRRWIAENLIRGEDGQNLQELGERYFYELVNSSLIEPIEFDNFGKDLAYRVHVTTLDLIVALSIEKDSVTILAGLQQIHLQDKNIQRLSLQVSNEQDDVRKATKTIGHNVRRATKSTFVQVTKLFFLAKTKKQKVTSLSVFCSTDLRNVSKFKGLDVLDLEKCDSLQGAHPNGLTKLYKLRYLALGRSIVVPPKISQLKQLQILDLTATGVKKLPSSIAKLTQLQRLLINRSTEVPDMIIGKLQALEELVEIDTSKSPSILEDIRTMPELRVLSIAMWSWDENNSIVLSKALCNLSTRKLKSLSISTCCSLDFMTDVNIMNVSIMDVKSILQHLEKLEIQGSTFNRLPNWIGKEAAVRNLQSLSIEVYQLENDAIGILGELSHLQFLSLASTRASEKKLVVARDGYSHLQTFLLFNRAMAIKFEEGAMKKLQRLKLTLQASLKEDFCFGLENLFSLKRIQVEIICFSATDRVVEEAENAMKSMIEKNPYKPTLTITKTVKEYKIKEKIREAQCERNKKEEDQEAGDARQSNRVLEQRRRAGEQGRGSIEDDLIYLT